jgi:hypothetical protein
VTGAEKALPRTPSRPKMVSFLKDLGERLTDDRDARLALVDTGPPPSADLHPLSTTQRERLQGNHR